MSSIKNIQHSTAELVELCRRGDKAAFEQLYHNYAKAMYNTALRICGKSEDAEDILQESFIAAYKALRGIDKSPVFGPWLRSIVVNRSIDFVRTKHKQFQLDENLIASQAEANEESVLTEQEPEYSVEEVHAAITELPDGFRVVLCLYLFEDLSHREIAARLGISEGTSKSQYARAKKKLIEIIIRKRKFHAR